MTTRQLTNENDTLTCEFCDRTLPSAHVPLAQSGDGPVAYCQDCRARDARLALEDAVPSWMHGLPLEMD